MAKATPKELSTGVLVVLRGDTPRALVLWRKDGTPDLPKGHVERGETELDAALRELHEEAGIAPQRLFLDENFVFQSRYKTKNKKTKRPIEKTVRLFLGYVNAPVSVTVSEHAGYAWLPIDDDEHVSRELHDNPTFLGAVRAYVMHTSETCRPS